MRRLIFLALAVMALASCSEKKEQVPYTVMESYFVKSKLNDPEPIQAIYDTREDFYKTFGVEKSDDGKLDTIDFEKQIAIGVIMPETQRLAELKPVTLQMGDGGLQFYYKVDQRKDTTNITSLPCLVIAVDRDKASRVILISEKTK